MTISVLLPPGAVVRCLCALPVVVLCALSLTGAASAATPGWGLDRSFGTNGRALVREYTGPEQYTSGFAMRATTDGAVTVATGSRLIKVSRRGGVRAWACSQLAASIDYRVTAQGGVRGTRPQYGRVQGTELFGRDARCRADRALGSRGARYVVRSQGNPLAAEPPFALGLQVSENQYGVIVHGVDPGRKDGSAARRLGANGRPLPGAPVIRPPGTIEAVAAGPNGSMTIARSRPAGENQVKVSVERFRSDGSKDPRFSAAPVTVPAYSSITLTQLNRRFIVIEAEGNAAARLLGANGARITTVSGGSWAADGARHVFVATKGGATFQIRRCSVRPGSCRVIRRTSPIAPTTRRPSLVLRGLTADSAGRLYVAVSRLRYEGGSGDRDDTAYLSEATLVARLRAP